MSVGMGSGAPDANANIIVGNHGKSVIFFALKQFISIQASGTFFTATSDFEVFHLALELVENQDGFPRILGADRVKTIILSPETWLKD